MSINFQTAALHGMIRAARHPARDPTREPPPARSAPIAAFLPMSARNAHPCARYKYNSPYPITTPSSPSSLHHPHHHYIIPITTSSHRVQAEYMRAHRSITYPTKPPPIRASLKTARRAPAAHPRPTRSAPPRPCRQYAVYHATHARKRPPRLRFERTPA